MALRREGFSLRRSTTSVCAAVCRHADQSFSLYYKKVICMTLNEFQKLLAPHTLVSLWAGPSLMLWGGEIEACDFTRYGNREITTINLYNRNYYRGFLVYLRPRG